MRTLVVVLFVLVAVVLSGAPPTQAAGTAAPPPLLQSWSDTGLISADDDWSRAPGLVGYRGDGLATSPGVDPRTVVADGSATPVDVTANRTDPRAVGLASGVAEFELADPVVAIQGSATASAPHLVLALDTRGRAGISVRFTLRDIDASAADALSAVAVQYRAGASGDFVEAPGGYVADATTGPSAATLVTPVRTTLPATANDQSLVHVRVITTNAAGQDEWIGVDDIEVTASAGGGSCPPPGTPAPAPPGSTPVPPGSTPVPPGSTPVPRPPLPRPRPTLRMAELTLSPTEFTPARKGGAIIRRGGAGLRFRLSRPALVRFGVIAARSTPEAFAPKPDAARRPRPTTGGRFSVRGERGLNRLRFSGRVRARPLAPGEYILRAVGIDRTGRESQPTAVRFRISDK